MIAIIDYRAGNLRSVERALRHLGVPCKITARPDEIISSEAVIFPGVGAAGTAIEVIRSQGLDKVINGVIAHKTPFLGICLGAQVILERSEEDGATCLGIIPGTAKRFHGTGIKIPHMGWNDITIVRPHPILDGIDLGAQFYFVHSYYPEPDRPDDVIAKTEYGITFASIIGRENLVATQFHLEKSGGAGLQILYNFSKWDGTVEVC